MVQNGFAAWAGWASVAILASAIGFFSLRFLSFDAAALTEELRPNLVNHPIMFYAHTIIAACALLAGIWQFLPVTRRSPLHRWLGRIYVACVVPASIAGFTIAITTESGVLAAIGFMILAVLWFAATVKAYLLARAGNYREHRVWMIRSYALTCAAISLRIILPLGLISGASFMQSYTVAAWGSWIINMLIAEWLIRTLRPGHAPTSRSLQT